MSNKDSTTNASTPGASGDVPQDAQAEQSTSERPKKNRQGQQSKQKRSEQHRYKKNQDWQKEKNERLFKKYADVLPDAVTELRPQEVAISKPVRSVDITTGYFNTIAMATIKTLYSACKIPPAADSDPERYDLQTIIWVTGLQIEAKFFFGSLGSPYLVDGAYNSHGRHLRVANLFPTALLPLAVGIDQIGKCVVDGQTIIGRPGPRLMQSNNEDDPRLKCPSVVKLFEGDDTRGMHKTPLQTLVDGVITPVYFRPIENTQILYDNEVLKSDGRSVYFNAPVYFALPLTERLNFGDLIAIREKAVPPPIETLAARYSEFIGRVVKKLNDQAFAPLELVKGIGTAAQLVGVECPEGDRALTYCTRDASSTDHTLSAYFLLGYGTGHVYHDEEIALQTSSVEIAGVPELLSTMLTKRLR